MTTKKPDFTRINEIIELDFENVAESDLRIAIRTFQKNYKELVQNLTISSIEVPDEQIKKYQENSQGFKINHNNE